MRNDVNLFVRYRIVDTGQGLKDDDIEEFGMKFQGAQREILVIVGI